jgi:hypothetical protein
MKMEAKSVLCMFKMFVLSNLWFKVSPTLQREGGREREFIKNGIPGSQGVGMSDAKCPLSR